VPRASGSINFQKERTPHTDKKTGTGLTSQLFTNMASNYSRVKLTQKYCSIRSGNETLDLHGDALELAAEDGLSGGLGHSGVGVNGNKPNHGGTAENHGTDDHTHDGVRLHRREVENQLQNFVDNTGKSFVSYASITAPGLLEGLLSEAGGGEVLLGGESA
jgi:hypothetical protein